MNSISSPCFICPDVRPVPCDDGRTSYYCTVRFVYVRPTRQLKMPRPCPYRTKHKRGRQFWSENGDPVDSFGRPVFECVWCGRRGQIGKEVRIRGQENRRYCSLKCRDEYLRTRRF